MATQKDSKIIEGLLKTMETAVSKMTNYAQAREDPNYKFVINQLYGLQTTNGSLLNTMDNLKKILQIKAKLEKFIVNRNYELNVADFLNAFNQVAEFNNKYFAAITANKPKQTLELATKNAINTALNTLTDAGVEVGITDGVKRILITNAQGGSSIADLSDQLREYMTTTEKTGDGSFTKYIRTYTQTAINQFSAEYHKTMSDDLGLEWYMYVGSLIETSREFCEKAVDKKYIHKDEFATILKGDFGSLGSVPLNKKTGLPNGLME